MHKEKRKERKAQPPVTGLIRSNKQAARSTQGLRDKKRPTELLNPSPGCRQCHKVSWLTDWLNKNTKSVEVPASHLGHLAPPLKGRRSYFSYPPTPCLLYVWKLSKCSETGDSEWRHSQNASGILVVKMMRGKKLLAAWLWMYEEVKKYGSFFPCELTFGI